MFSSSSPPPPALAAAPVLLLSGVLRGATRLTDSVEASSSSRMGGGSIGRSRSQSYVLDQVTFAAPVHPSLLRVLHKPPPRGGDSQHSAAASSSAATAASAFGTSAPARFELECWALDANSEVEASMARADESNVAIRKGGGLTPPLQPPPRPWDCPEAGWRRLTPPASSSLVTFPADPVRSDAADCNVILPLTDAPSRPTSSSSAAAAAAAASSFATKRILLRGTYSHVSVMVYGKRAASTDAPPVQKEELRNKLEQLRLKQSAALQLADQAEAPVHAHACFRPLLPLYSASIQRHLVFDEAASADIGRRLGERVIDAPLECEAARVAVAALVHTLRHAHLLQEEQPDTPIASFIRDDTMQQITEQILAVQHRLEALDDYTRAALLSDDTSEFSAHAQLLTASLSFLLASSSSASAASVSVTVYSFDRLRHFVRSLTTPLPFSLVQTLSTALSLLLHPSFSLALIFAEQGAGWMWLLGWIHQQNAAEVSGVQRTIALGLVDTLLQHPQAIQCLLDQKLLGPDAALSALLSLSSLLHTSGAASAALPSSCKPLVIAIRHKVILHQLFLTVNNEFAELKRAKTADRVRIGYKQLLEALKKLLAFIGSTAALAGGCSGGDDAPAMSRELAHSFLQHAEQFQFLATLQVVFDASNTGALATIISPFELFQQLVRPALMLGFFGPHTSMQHVLHVCCEEQVTHGLLKSLREMAARMKPPPNSPASVTLDDEQLPWQQILELLGFVEGRAQAMQILLHCAPSPSCPPHLRASAWSFLATFLQAHPFGVDSVAFVLQQAQEHVSAFPAAAASTPLASLHGLLLGVFQEASDYSPIMQRHALSVLHTLFHSTQANSLFFAVRGRIPLLPQADLVALLNQMAASLTAALASSATDPTHSSVTQAFAQVGMLQKHHEADQSPWIHLMDALQTRAATLTGSTSVTVANLPLTQRVTQLSVVADMMTQGESRARYLPVPADHVTRCGQIFAAPGSAKFKQRKVEMDNQRLAVKIFFPTSDGARGAAAASPVSASPSSPLVSDLLRIFSQTFVVEQSDDPALASSASSISSSSSRGGSHLSMDSIRLMQAAAEGLDALLGFLLHCLEFIASSRSKHLEALRKVNSGETEVEEGELHPEAVCFPMVLTHLASLHQALWSVHEILSTSELHYHYFVEAVASRSGARPPSPHSSSLGFLPRVRRNLHCCLSHTLFHLLAPENLKVHPHLLAYVDEAGLPPLSSPESVQVGPVKWWSDQLFGPRLSMWIPNMRFLVDILPKPWTRNERGNGDGVQRLNAWQAYQKDHLFKPLLKYAEFGPDLPAGSPPLLVEPRLVSSFLLSDAFLSSGSLNLLDALTHLVASVVESASPVVGLRVLERFAHQLLMRGKLTHDALEGLVKANFVSEVEVQLKPTASAAPLIAASTFVHLAFYRQLQLLRALLHYPRVRWLFNELDVLTRIRPLLQLSVPSTSALRLDVLPAHRPAVHEAISFQLLALECARLCLDSSPVAVLPGGKDRVDADVNWINARWLLPSITPLLLHSSPFLALASGRLLLTMAQTPSGCRELLQFMGHAQNVAFFHTQVWSSNGLLFPHASEGNGWIGAGSLLLSWLTTRIEQFEMVNPRLPMHPVELELWGQVASILRCILTMGDDREELGGEALMKPLGPKPTTVPGEFTDRWWANSIATVLPGLKSLCVALRWPLRLLPHTGNECVLLLQSAAVLPFMPILPAHPLPRIVSRLTLCSQSLQQASAASSSSSSAAAGVSTHPSVLLQLSSLIDAFGAIVHRCQLAGVLCLPDADVPVSPSQQSLVSKYNLIHRLEQHTPTTPEWLAATNTAASLPSAAAPLARTPCDVIFPAALPFVPVPSHLTRTPLTPMPSSVHIAGAR